MYHLSIEYKNNFLSKEELIIQISNSRGGFFIDVTAALIVICGIIILLINDWGLVFQLNPHLIGSGKSAGPRSITVTGMTQNAGFDKKYPSSRSWDYVHVIKELAKQSSKNKIEIQVGDQIYRFKNTYR